MTITKVFSCNLYNSTSASRHIKNLLPTEAGPLNPAFGSEHNNYTHPLTAGMTLAQAAKLFSNLYITKQKARMIYGANIVTENSKITPASVLLIGNKIHSIWPVIPGFFQYFSKQIEWIDARGKLLTPGLIDQHTHGGYGTNFNTSGQNEIKNLLQKLPEHGVTSILSSLITDSASSLKGAIDRLKPFVQNKLQNATQLLGIHLEGPYLNESQRRCHPKEHLAKPPESIADILTPESLPVIKSMTIAPELDNNYQLTKLLTSQGIRVSAGHSEIGYNQMRQANYNGVTGVTHLYNAMPQVHHRTPGLIGAGLTLPHIWPELIADGYHVSIPMMQVTAKAKPNELILVTDASPLAGEPSGSSFSIGNEKYILNQGQVTNPTGVIAGSSAFLDDCVRNMVKWHITDFPHAVNMASKHAADFLGLKNLGRIQPNAIANLLLWRPDDLAIEQTIIDGNTVYKRP